MTVREITHPADPSPPGRLHAAAPEELLARLEDLLAAGRLAIAGDDALALDGVAVACARGGGAFELAIGEGLDALARGGDVRLGFSGVGDLARERLGVAAWQAQRLRRNAVALRSRPLLRDAVLAGQVSTRKAEVVMARAYGADEALWVERAKVDTVRALEAAVAGAERGDAGPGVESDVDWHRIRLALPKEQSEIVEGALEVAKILQGPTSPMWRRLWAISAEFLSSYPIDPLERPAPRRPPAPPVWQVEPGVANGSGADPVPPRTGAPRTEASLEAGPLRGVPSLRAPRDPYDLLAELTRLVAERAGADEQLRRACLLVKRFGVARRLGWSSFEEWCAERLGLAPSTVYQRIALERRMAELPELREALRARRLSYEQARHVARVATRSTVAARIAEAAGKTCLELQRGIEAEEHLQMWNAGELRAVVPEDVGELLSDALRSARLHAGRPITPGEALVWVAGHFALTWVDEATRILLRAHRVVVRDGGLCRMPGCSRPAAHVHHIRQRSAGGPLEAWNEVSLCLVHHLLGVHRGNALVTGQAPDGLAFVLGEREVLAAVRAGGQRLPV
jgi:hypothetical protein